MIAGGSIRFLLDGMLGKTARWLRMIGYEVTYYKDREDSDLLSIARRDSLLLMTADMELYRTAVARGIEAVLVEGSDESVTLANLAQRYNLNLTIDPSLSRCPLCGHRLREASKQNAKDLVPAATFKTYQSFWVCTNQDCGKAYWQGSHWKRITQTLEKSRRILEDKKSLSFAGKHTQ